jgi:hypothetical protein
MVLLLSTSLASRAIAQSGGAALATTPTSGGHGDSDTPFLGLLGLPLVAAAPRGGAPVAAAAPVGAPAPVVAEAPTPSGAGGSAPPAPVAAWPVGPRMAAAPPAAAPPTRRGLFGGAPGPAPRARAIARAGERG